MRLKFWEAEDVSWDGVWHRLVMRVAHKFHWHYMPPFPMTPDDKIHIRCDWCGIRQIIHNYDDTWIDKIANEMD